MLQAWRQALLEWWMGLVVLMSSFGDVMLGFCSSIDGRELDGEEGWD
jgi:hypothetical protein